MAARFRLVKYYNIPRFLGEDEFTKQWKMSLGWKMVNKLLEDEFPVMDPKRCLLFSPSGSKRITSLDGK